MATGEVKVKVDAELTPEAERVLAMRSVDSGWLSRKLFVGVLIGLLAILLSCFLMFVAMTGLFLADVPDAVAKTLVKFDPLYWVLGFGFGLLFVAAHTGLISLDKVIDLIRETLPILKARFGVPPAPKVGE